MATANSTGVRSRADHSGRTAPVTALSVADEAAHAAASHVRPFLSPSGAAALDRLVRDTAGWASGSDSDPDMDEALRRVRSHGRALRAGMAEYREYVGEVAA